jgi:23S rRNA (pseudouridine1915-N3)-methyltransferase
MQWRILAIGKPRLPYARSGIEEYSGRLRHCGAFQIEYLKSGTRESESAALLKRSAGLRRVVLDERGTQIGSRALADRLTGWELQGQGKGIALLIGGADGHTESLRQSADWIWSLTPLTLQHELALVVVLEQLYRAYSIKSGSPYHRD